MKKRNKISKKKLLPFIYAFATFIILFILTISYTRYAKGQWEKDERANLYDLMTSKKSNLEKALYSRIYYTRGVAAYVGLNPDISNTEFNELAKEYIKNDSVISSMALSKNCVLNAIFPLKNHESAIGLDLLKHPERKEIVEKTIETRLTFVAGPVELVEGGSAFVSYTPIFNKKYNELNDFWGVTDIVIKKDKLLEEAGLNNKEAGFIFSLRGYNGTGKNGSVFWGDASIFNKNPVITAINLPIGNWELAAIPIVGWDNYLDQDKALLTILIISIFIISLLILIISKALLKIRYNEREMKAILNSIDSVIVEFSFEGEYLNISYTNKDLLYLPEEEIIGKNIFEIFNKKQATQFKNAIEKCVNEQRLVNIEYQLEIKNKQYWFSARITPKSKNTVILNAYDITEKKQQEKLLIESEQKLKKLNEMKDQFFSIIAHDLKNPLGSQKALLDLIIEEYDLMDDEKRINLLKATQKSSEQLNHLLTDLLKWAMSQSGKIILHKNTLNVGKTFDELFEQLGNMAKLKDINFVNAIAKNSIIIGDPDLTAIVLRNLVSNAIKFTERKGQVKIYSESIFYNGKCFQKITIADNGIGIHPDKLNNLFRIDKTESVPGTENEKGTGLGLLLCQEFIEKQGGKIFVESTFGKGSEFSFILPTSQSFCFSNENDGSNFSSN
ncbi:PAS domain S-box protein [Lutibacter sp. HS1-25]|uniref:ATP-binding protein n=1 Tax=Lutibacter sp. HS1-25 TaxID=2485000 RepID=UPI0010118A2C|nr:ATP-binding protein [Lutibacter sp. HS1-25]RXP63570.1 PAS domain S-box protein [Lutibacter sp. HS1-25]